MKIKKINVDPIVIVRLYWCEGKTLDEIGRMFDCSPVSVYQYCLRHDIPTRWREEHTQRTTLRDLHVRYETFIESDGYLRQKILLVKTSKNKYKLELLQQLLKQHGITSFIKKYHAKDVNYQLAIVNPIDILKVLELVEYRFNSERDNEKIPALLSLIKYRLLWR